MNYASQDQLVERYGNQLLVDLTDRATPPSGAIDADVVTRALDDTNALIDGYLKGRYLLPLATTPPLLTDLAQQIAIYKLHKQMVSDKIQRDYDGAIATLKQIANGIVRLDVAGVEPAASGSQGVQFNDRDRDMTPDNMTGFI